MILCHQCSVWFQCQNDKNYGSCRRHAPSPVLLDGDSVVNSGTHRAVWPYTRSIDGCQEGINGKPQIEGVSQAMTPAKNDPQNVFNKKIEEAYGKIKGR